VLFKNFLKSFPGKERLLAKKEKAKSKEAFSKTSEVV
jgi:hypothetical protein